MKTFSKYLSKVFHIFAIYGLLNGFLIIVKLMLPGNLKIKLKNLNDKIHLRNIVTDRGIFHQVFVELEYEFPFNLKENPIIIDAGGNIGLFSVFMKNKFPSSKIITIEPDEENFNLLKKNTSNFDNIFYEKSGLWNKKTKIKVYDKYHTGKSGLIVEEDEINGNLDAVSIDYLMSKYNIDKIDLLKIDIETSEIEVFSQNFENWISKTKYLVIELHDRIKVGCGRTFFNAINKSLNNYKIEVKGENIFIENLDF